MYIKIKLQNILNVLQNIMFFKVLEIFKFTKKKKKRFKSCYQVIEAKVAIEFYVNNTCCQ